jgi:hypothetical protein
VSSAPGSAEDAAAAESAAMRRVRGRSGSGAVAKRGLVGDGAGAGEGRKRSGGGWRARRRGRRREVAQEEQSDSKEDAIAARVLGATELRNER